MYTITPQDFATLVQLSQMRGITPFDTAIVLYLESGGFNPASAGPGGAGGANGLNQMTPENLQGIGFTPASWRALTAAQQLPYIFAWWDGIAKQFRPQGFPPTAGDLAALNFLPARYQSRGAATNPDAPLTSSPESYYTQNTFYDPQSTGSITVNTMRARQQMSATGARWNQIVAGIQAAGGGSPLALPDAANASLWLLGGLALGGVAAWMLTEPRSHRRPARRPAWA